MEGRRLISKVILLAFLFSFLNPRFAAGTPQGAEVVGGSASVSQPSVGLTLINQQSDKAIINWNSFGLGAGELAQFLQPSSNSVTLNRVVGGDPSLILGALRANGQVFFINPNGIIFGQGSQVNAAGVLASTLSMSNADFLSGNYHLVQPSNYALSGVVNQGNIQAGVVALVAPLVHNSGMIQATQGQVALGATTEAVVSFDLGQPLINFPNPNLNGTPGTVVLPAYAVDDILKSVVNNQNVLSAGGMIQNSGGTVSLMGAEGLALNSGTISANGSSGVSAGRVVVNSTQATVLTSGSLISANGSGINSNGGDVRILSKGKTIFAAGATLEAKAGDTGDGGFIETSGDQVWADGTVDTSATSGSTGTFLIDPKTLTIIDAAAGTGTQDGELPSIPFGGPDKGANTISTGTLKKQATNILLQATQSITINDLSTLSGGILTLKPNVGLTMQTQTGNIVFLNPRNTIAASGTGFFKINAGLTAGSGGKTILGNLTTASGAVTVTSDGSLSYGAITTGGGAVSLTSANGAILASTSLITSPNVMLKAKTGIGTLSSPVLLASYDTTLSATTTGASAGIFATFSGNNLTVSTNNSDVKLNGSGGRSLNFSGSTDALSANGYSTTSFANTGGSIMNSGSTANIQASDLLSLFATGGIGSASQSLLINTSHLVAQVTAGGTSSIYIGSAGTSLTLNSVTTKGNITLTSSTGAITIGAGTAVSGANVNLSATDTTAGLIKNLNSTSRIIATGSLTLIAATGIGAAGSSIIANSHTVNLTTAGAAAPIFFRDLVSFTALSVTTKNSNATISGLGSSLSFVALTDILGASMSGTALSFTNQAGNLVLKSVTTGSGNATFTASGSITGTGLSPNVTAGNLTLSGSSIGTSTTALAAKISGTLSATTTSGSINISDAGALTLGVITSAGDLTLTSTGAMTGVGSLLTANNVKLYALGLGSALAAINTKISGTLTAVTTGGSIFISNTGSLALGAITSSNDITISATGAMTSSGSLLFGKNVNLTGLSIGTTSGAINTSVFGTLTATSTGGSIFIANTGSLAIGAITSSGNITLLTTGAMLDNGSLLTGTNVTLTAVSVGANASAIHGAVTGVLTVNASGGSIFFANAGSLLLGSIIATGAGHSVTLSSTSNLLDAGSNIVGDNIKLIAGGTIGTGTPLNVKVRNGSLSVSAGAASSGISVNINGTISPTLSIVALAPLPGEVLFNGACVLDCPPTPTGGGTPGGSPPPPPPTSPKPPVSPLDRSSGTLVDTSILNGLNAPGLPFVFTARFSFLSLTAFAIQGNGTLTPAGYIVPETQPDQNDDTLAKKKKKQVI